MRVSSILRLVLAVAVLTIIISISAMAIHDDRTRKDADELAAAINVLAREDGLHPLRPHIPDTYHQLCLLPPYSPADPVRWDAPDPQMIARGIKGLDMDLNDEGAIQVILIGGPSEMGRVTVSHAAISRRAGAFDIALPAEDTTGRLRPARCMPADGAAILALGPRDEGGQRRFMIIPGVADVAGSDHRQSISR